MFGMNLCYKMFSIFHLTYNLGDLQCTARYCIRLPGIGCRALSHVEGYYGIIRSNQILNRVSIDR